MKNRLAGLARSLAGAGDGVTFQICLAFVAGCDFALGVIGVVWSARM